MPYIKCSKKIETSSENYNLIFLPASRYFVAILNIILKWVSSVDDFNLKFKKHSEKLKHYEGEPCKNWRRRETTIRA